MHFQSKLNCVWSGWNLKDLSLENFLLYDPKGEFLHLYLISNSIKSRAKISIVLSQIIYKQALKRY